MQNIAETNECQYSRYGDTLTFSSKTHSEKDLEKIFKDSALRSISAFGFKADKPKMDINPRERFIVTGGIVVNVKPNLSNRDVKEFRAKVHHATVIHPERTTRKHINKLKGWAAYLMSINPEKGKKYLEKLLNFEKSKWQK